MEKCKKAPKGWTCTRERGHDGPCAAIKNPSFWDAVGEAIGEALFGGRR